MTTTVANISWFSTLPESEKHAPRLGQLPGTALEIIIALRRVPIVTRQHQDMGKTIDAY